MKSLGCLLPHFSGNAANIMWFGFWRWPVMVVDMGMIVVLSSLNRGLQWFHLVYILRLDFCTGKKTQHLAQFFEMLNEDFSFNVGISLITSLYSIYIYVFYPYFLHLFLKFWRYDFSMHLKRNDEKHKITGFYSLFTCENEGMCRLQEEMMMMMRKRTVGINLPPLLSYTKRGEKIREKIWKMIFCFRWWHMPKIKSFLEDEDEEEKRTLRNFRWR